MDVVWDDNGDLIYLPVVMMLFFTPGGDFTLENEMLHDQLDSRYLIDSTLDSSMVHHICAWCAILCTVVLDYVSKSQQNGRCLGWQWWPHWPSDDVVLHTRRWFHAWKRSASWANRRCWQVDPFYNHDDDDMMMIEWETRMTTNEWNPNIVLYSYTGTEIFYGARVRARFWTQ